MILRAVRLAVLCCCFAGSAQAQAVAPTTTPAPTTNQTTKLSMEFWEAATLGVVEGLTEYLPVSSTGHLILTQRALGMGLSETDEAAADAYAIVIQLGAILAVLGIYFSYIRRMVLGVFGKDPEGLRLSINVIVGFIPAAIVGLTLGDLIKEYLFGLWPVVFAWFVGGVAIMLVERRRARKDRSVGDELFAITWKQALTIGLFQCVAVWPGTSRSLMTILGGCVSGLTLHAAVIFSFLLGAVTLSASTAYDALKHGAEMIDVYGLVTLLVGLAFAFVSAALAVKWMVAYLNRHSLVIFGVYRIILAVVVSALLLANVLQP